MKDNLAEIVKKSKAKVKYDPNLEYIKEESKYEEVKNDHNKI